MEREMTDYRPLLIVFKPKLIERGFHRIDSLDRGFRTTIVVTGQAVDAGWKFHGTDVSISCGICRVQEATGFVYGPIPDGQVCLRRITQEPLSLTPIAVRLDTSWLDEELLWQQVSWLLQSAVQARRAYDQGIESLRR